MVPLKRLDDLIRIQYCDQLNTLNDLRDLDLATYRITVGV